MFAEITVEITNSIQSVMVISELWIYEHQAKTKLWIMSHLRWVSISTYFPSISACKKFLKSNSDSNHTNEVQQKLYTLKSGSMNWKKQKDFSYSLISIHFYGYLWDSQCACEAPSLCNIWVWNFPPVKISSSKIFLLDFGDYETVY